MNQNTGKFRFGRKRELLIKFTVGTFLMAAFALSAFSQDDDTIRANVLDAGNSNIGRAELIPDTGDVKTNFGYNIKVWLDGGSRMRIIRPQSGSRSTSIVCSFREYKVDPKNPNDKSHWDETGSGTASLQMPATGDVKKISVSMTLTKKVVGDDDVEVNEKPQKIVIVLN